MNRLVLKHKTSSEQMISFEVFAAGYAQNAYQMSVLSLSFLRSGTYRPNHNTRFSTTNALQNLFTTFIIVAKLRGLARAI
ncbi:hypothetical protein EI42_00612 [Thermosporothrix hazakensis]|jgi:hypothetical protein|uniref:Uncharacterized protein n=1 Tax=Thermosporothrix hazakensis TaxID=644383 RepID=A0A326UD87_THEHA|nr:hypothetical protein EI42_00612 [Thermosporothrix hazakensis]GCE47091.1 hypothetical protein KTH_19600 [Thermosporothrix hazakensis]